MCNCAEPCDNGYCTCKEYSLLTNEEFLRFYLEGLEVMEKTKSDIFANLSRFSYTIDYALPQDFLDMLTKESGLDYNLILSTTCWVYTRNDYFGGPVSCCIEVQDALEKYYFHK